MLCLRAVYSNVCERVCVREREIVWASICVSASASACVSCVHVCEGVCVSVCGCVYAWYE